MTQPITIRPATPADALDVRRLSALDDRRPPRGRTLLAFVDGELAAAKPLDGRDAVADPFRHTAHLLAMLELQTRLERDVA
jgi:hypothetical protein